MNLAIRGNEFEAFGGNYVPQRLQRQTSAVVYPGELLTFDFINKKKEHKKTVDNFFNLLDSFNKDQQHEAYEDCSVSKPTYDAAKRFFTLLLEKTESLPRISPSGDGGLEAIWKNGQKKTILVVDSWVLNLVTGATTPQAEYFEDIRFDEQKIPDQIEKELLEELA